MILANGVSQQRLCKMTFGDLGSPYLQDTSIVWIPTLQMTIVSTITFSQGIVNVLRVTDVRPRVLVLKGLLPLVFYCNMFICLFVFTDWAWTHFGFVIMLVCPISSLINSRQIVCNFTRQNMPIVPKSTLWYLMFPLNKITGTPLVDEALLAYLIFAITGAWYLHFAIGTIQ